MFRWWAGYPRPFVPGHAKRKPRGETFPVLTVAEAAYIAAIIDGEGSIIDRGEARRSFMVVVANTDLPLIDWLQSFGGRVSDKPDYGTGFKATKRCWTWAVHTRRDILSLLTQVEPYMIVKRDKAIRAIEIITDILENQRLPPEPTTTYRK